MNVLNKYDEEFGSQVKTLKTNISIEVHWGLLYIDERAFHQYVGRAEPSKDIFTLKELCTVCTWLSGINFQRKSFIVWQKPHKSRAQDNQKYIIIIKDTSTSCNRSTRIDHVEKCNSFSGSWTFERQQRLRNGPQMSNLFNN